MREFLQQVVHGDPTVVSPLAARAAVAAGALAAESICGGSRPLDVPSLPAHVADYFARRSIPEHRTS